MATLVSSLPKWSSNLYCQTQPELSIRQNPEFVNWKWSSSFLPRIYGSRFSGDAIFPEPPDVEEEEEKEEEDECMNNLE